MTVDMACTVLTLFSSPALTSGSCFSKPAAGRIWANLARAGGNGPRPMMINCGQC